MGWLKIGFRASQNQSQIVDIGNSKFTTEHIEDVTADVGSGGRYQKVALTVHDSELPFIPSSEVITHNSKANEGLWIVVDNVVYDCTEFLAEHPGGEQVIKSFGGAECSWQFWRFHGKKEMEQDGKPLRIGRTLGLENKYAEPQRYVGLRNRNDDW